MFLPKDNRKAILALVTVLALGFNLLAGCAPAATQAPAPATQVPAVATQVPAVTEAAAPAPVLDWKAVVRPATKKWKIGYGDGLAGIPFTASVTKSINDTAAKMGVEIVYCDNAYNQEKTVECSNALVTKGAEGVVFANWIAGTEDMVAGIFHTAKIPCVTYDGPHPGCVAFGPDNFTAAKEAGKFLGEYAKKMGWDPKDVSLITIWSPDVPVHKARADGAKEGVKETLGIPDANIYDVGTKEFNDVQANVTSFLTGHPNLKYVLCFGHSDQPGVDCGLALDQAGYLGRAAAVGTGASTEALVELRDRTDAQSIFKATISYFPERYGEYLIPAIVDLLEGVKVPERILPGVSPITRENVNQLYPGEWKAVVRPATKKWKIGYGDGLAGIPFTASVTKSINDTAAKMGVEIVYCDNAYNQEKTVECSNALVTKGAEGVVFANWIAGTEDMVAGIFHTAKIPCVTYDGPHPGCVAFGPDNFTAAKEAGKFLGEYAKKMGWDPKDVSLITIWSPDVPVHKARADGAKEGVKETLGIPDANIYDVGTKEFNDVQANVTSFLTGHPNLKYVLCFGHSDQPGVDCGLALEQAGYLGRAASVGTGASTEALVELRNRTDAQSIFKATISYFPERYGEYLIPAIVDLLEGIKVPERILPGVAPITRDNVNQLYPAP